MHRQSPDFLWMDVSKDRSILLSSLALERRSHGSQSYWYPVRVDENGAAWRLGTPRFLDNEEVGKEAARCYVEDLASHDPTNALMRVSPGLDPVAIGAASMLASALSMLLFYLPLGIHPSFLAPISVFLTTVCLLTAWGTEHLEDPNED